MYLKPNPNTNVDLCIGSKVVSFSFVLECFVCVCIRVNNCVGVNLCVVRFDVYYSQVMRCDLSSVEVET